MPSKVEEETLLTSEEALEKLCREHAEDPVKTGIGRIAAGGLEALASLLPLGGIYLAYDFMGGPVVQTGDVVSDIVINVTYWGIGAGLGFLTYLGMKDAANRTADGLVKIWYSSDKDGPARYGYVLRDEKYIRNPSSFDLEHGTMILPVSGYTDLIWASSRKYDGEVLINGVEVIAEEAINEVRHYEVEEDEKPTEDDYDYSEYTARVPVSINGFPFILKTETEDDDFIQSVRDLKPGDRLLVRGPVYKSRKKADKGFYVLDIEEFDKAMRR